MSWTDSEVVTYITYQLGYPKRNIELDRLNIVQALKRAVRYYATKKPVIRLGIVNIIIGQQKYDFTSLGLSYGKGLLSLNMAPITSPQAAFTVFDYYRMRLPPDIAIDELLAEKMYYKDIGYITGTDFDWHWDHDGKILLVTPAPTRSCSASYEYNAIPSKIDEVPDTDQGWVVDYTLALCKEMLGRVRGKFKGVPGNDLPVDTDGDALLSEAFEAQEKLKESLNASRGDWTPPLKG